jgi:ABC-type nitrate/sulfonate/bicarbonate transport system permease component
MRRRHRMEDMCSGKISSIALRVLPVPILILAWGLIAQAGFLTSALFPSPYSTLLALVDMIFSGELLRDVLATMGRAIAGFCVGSVFGVVIGTLTARIRALDQSLGQVIQLLRPIPPIAMVPLAVVWLGLGEGSKLAIVAWGVFFPVWLNTYVGVSGVEKDLVRAARSLGASEERLLFQVILPAALRHVIAGMRIAVAISLICVVVAEMIGASVGLGYRINTSYLVFRVDRMVVGLAMLGIVGFLTDKLFVSAVSWFMPWYSTNEDR